MENHEKETSTLKMDFDRQEKSPISREVPTMRSVVMANSSMSVGAQKDYSAGAIDESMLNEDERRQIDEFAKEIDIADVDQVVKYGVAAQRNISDFSVSILKQVRTYDLGEVGMSLKELTVALDATTEPEKKGIWAVFQKAKRGMDSIRANYAKAESNVDRVEKDLQKHQMVLTQDISIYQQMYELNVEYYKQLTMYIIAGKKALESAKIGKLEEFKRKAELTNKQEDVQEYRDFEDQCHRFEKKIGDLEITRVISIQSAPQVRMLQNNDREMLDKIQSSLANTIPLWRNQLVMSLGVEHSKRALEAQTSLTDKTNELLLKNSESLKMATIGTAREAERSIIDIATLRQCNRDLIFSINEVVKIHERGNEQRERVQGELIKIEEELKHVMLESGGRRR